MVAVTVGERSPSGAALRDRAERRVCAACGLQVRRGRAAPNGQFWRGLSRVAVLCRATAWCGIGARGSYLWRLVLQRRVSWIRPPGCDCGFRNQQERDDYAAPALLDDFELAIWS